ADPDGTLRTTGTFTLPESAVGAGATTIVTAADMLAFGRMHLHDGVAPNGTRILSAESAQAMRTVTFDLGIPQTPPMGLGWWLPPIAGTTAASHLGGSPGGISSFCILPERDAVVISVATGPGGLFGPGGFSLHDVLHNAVIEELTGQKPTAPVDLSAE